jgi:hypothetical protein
MAVQLKQKNTIMIKKYNTLLLLLISIVYIGHSPVQAQSRQKVKLLEKEAWAHYDALRFYQALPILLNLHDLNPKHQDYQYYLGMCYLNTRQSEKAVPYFEKCLTEPDKYNVSLYYNAAKAYHHSHQLDEAIKYYTIYKNKISAPKHRGKHAETITKVEREIQMCHTGKKLMANKLDVEVVSMGSAINSPFPEYGPVISADESTLIFTSCRPNTTGGHKDETDGYWFEDIYISHKTNGVWSEPEKLGPGINTANHDASISLSADGQKLLLYRSSSGGEAGGGNLYISELNGDTWMPATKISTAINSKAWEPSACLSLDENILYFSSNRKGGLGGTDLYSARRLPNGEWAQAQSLGATINTPYDEDSPFIHPDGKTLYFSSNGHNTMGGYDIFVSTLNEETGEWSVPENVGYPINTAQDDIYFSWSADGRRCYFSSVREGGEGDKDLYYANLNKRATQMLVLNGKITNALTQQPVSTNIRVSDYHSGELTGVYTSNSSTGKYVLVFNPGKTYHLVVETEGFAPYEESVQVHDTDEFELFEKDIKLQPLAKPKPPTTTQH